MANRFEFKGGRELEAKLRQLADQKAADRIGNFAIRKGAKHLEKAILDNAPVGTAPTARRRRTKSGAVTTADYGRITTNLRVRKSRARIAVADVEYGITRGNAFWAKLVEFGTVKMRAQPFVRPAVDAEGDATIEVVNVELGKSIERIFKRRGIALD